MPASLSAHAEPPPAAASQPSLLARRLGHAGLIPFVAGALLVWLVYDEAHPYVALALSAYAALVASFLGGIHWGLAMRQAQPPVTLLVWGVVPSLLAWLAVLMPPQSALVLEGLLLLGCYAVDRRLYPAQGAAQWLTLRFRLSAGAAMSCFIGAAGS